MGCLWCEAMELVWGDLCPWCAISELFGFYICRAVGCILGELLNGSPLFPGENDIEQLCCVLRILGTPSPQVWPVCRGLWWGVLGAGVLCFPRQ